MEEKWIGLSTKKILLISIVIATLFIGIGYAAINSVTFSMNGQVVGVVQDGIFITDVRYVDSKYAVVEESDILSFNQTNLNSHITLEEHKDAYITYEITIYNSYDIDFQYDETNYITCESYNSLCETYSNNNIKFDLSISPRTLLEAKNSITFNITFRYVDGYNESMDNELKSLLNFKFKQMVSIQSATSIDSIYGSYYLDINCPLGDLCSKLTVNNFLLEIHEIDFECPSYGPMTFTYDYNPTTGIYQVHRQRLIGPGFITYTGDVIIMNNPLLVGTASGSYNLKVDVSSVRGYQNMTVDDFYYVIDFLDAPQLPFKNYDETVPEEEYEYGVQGTMEINKSYNPNTGILTVNRSSIRGTGTVTFNISVYIVD